MKTELREPDEYFLVGQDDSRLPIYLRYQLFRALEDFAKREQREQVGLLVGRVCQEDDDLAFVLVEDAIEAPLGDEKTGRFEESLWKRARRIAAARHPNRTIVGWFHTHLEGEVAISDEERTVHKRYFPEESHLLYIVSAQAQDRNFFFRADQELKPATGFRIYGKPATNSDNDEIIPVSGGKHGINSVEASQEQQSRQVDRTLDKIHRHVQSPPFVAKDYLIIGLLVVNALLIWFRPNPPVQVDTSSLERGQSEISAQVSSVRGRIEKLESHLADLTVLDEQLKLAAGLENIDGIGDDPGNRDEDPAPVATTTASGNPNSGKLSGGASAIKLYKVAEGDILGVLVEKFYPNAPNGTTRSFSQFNRLKGDAIFPGDVLKVPELEALK